jgi:hypothetical protein
VSLACPAARSGPIPLAAAVGLREAVQTKHRWTAGSLYNGELASRTLQYFLPTCLPTDTFSTAGR